MPSVHSPDVRDRLHVVVVLVLHDGARWLPEVLDGLCGQTRPPDRVVVVDTGGADDSMRLVEQAGIPGLSTLTLPPRTGFGAAVERGLRQAVAPVDGTGWVWLLHDDAAPDPDALQRLLAVAATTPSAALLGPKLVDWYDVDRLQEVGVSVDSAGRRCTGLEPAELDQGQRDAVRDVLAVSTAGALVRRDVFAELGGLAPELPLAADDLDLGWRVRDAGHRVLAVPAARVRHAAAARAGRRTPAALDRDFSAAERRHGLWVVLANAGSGRFALLLPRVLVGGLLRVLGLLALRRFTAARREAGALAGVLGRPGILLAARRTRAATRTAGSREAGRLLVGPRERVRGVLDRLGERAAPNRPVPRSALESGPTTAEDELPDVRGGLLARLLTRPPVMLALGLGLLALVAARGWPLSGLVGGRLLPAPGLGALWGSYAGAWHPTGPGSGAAAPPYLAVVAGLAAVLGGSTRTAVSVLLLGSVPLAGLTAYLALGRVVCSRWLRTAGGATYALLPVGTGALSAGRLGDAVAIALLPAVVATTGGLVRRDAARTGWSPAWRAGLLLALAAAFAPLTWPLIALVLVAGLLASAAAVPAAVASRRVLAALVVLGVPLALLAPWTLALLRHPGLVLLGAAPLTASEQLVDPRLTGLDVTLLRPGGPGLPPLWITAGLLVVALAGLLRRDRAVLVRAGWVLAGIGLIAGFGVSRAQIRVPGRAGDAVAPWPGVALALGALGLLLAAAVGGEGVRYRLARGHFGWRQPALGLLVAGVLIAPLGGAVVLGGGLLNGRQDPLRPAGNAALPAFAAAETGPGERVLFLAPDDGSVRFTLADRDGSRLGDADLPTTAPAARRLDGAVAELVSGGGDAVAALATFGVRFVVMPASADAGLVGVLDQQSGLVRESFEGSQTLWRLAVPAPRLAVLSPPLAALALGGQAADAAALATDPPVALPVGVESARATVAPGPADRLLVLAETADDGWRATLDGHDLPHRTAWGWAQAFALPAAGGRLVLHHGQAGRHALLWLQLVGLVVVVLLAVPGPGPSPPPRAPASAPRREPQAATSGAPR